MTLSGSLTPNDPFQKKGSLPGLMNVLSPCHPFRCAAECRHRPIGVENSALGFAGMPTNYPRSMWRWPSLLEGLVAILWGGPSQNPLGCCATNRYCPSLPKLSISCLFISSEPPLFCSKRGEMVKAFLWLAEQQSPIPHFKGAK